MKGYIKFHLSILCKVMLIICVMNGSLQAAVIADVKKAVTDFKALVVNGFNQWKANPKAETPRLLDELGYQVMGKIPAQTITLLDNPSIQLINPNVASFAALPENMRGYILRGTIQYSGQNFSGQFFTLEKKDAAGNPTGQKFRGLGIQTSGNSSVYDLLKGVGLNLPDLNTVYLPSFYLIVTDDFGADTTFKFAATDEKGADIVLDVAPGLTFAASMKMDGALSKVQDLFNRLQKTKTFSVTGGSPSMAVRIPYPLINPDLNKIAIGGALPWRFGIDFDQLRKDGTISKDADKYFKLKSFIFGDLYLDISAKAQLSLGGKAWLALTTQANPLEMGVSGSLGAAGTEFNAAMKGMWDPALGLEWLALGNIGFSIGVDYAAQGAAALIGLPFTQLALAADFGLGKRGTTSVVSVGVGGGISITSGTPPPPPFMGFFGNLKEDLDISYIIAWFSEVLNKATKGQIREVNISSLPEIKIIKGSGLALATADKAFGPKGFERGYKQGFSFNLDAKIAGHNGKLNLVLDIDNDRLAGDASLDPIYVVINNQKIVNIMGAKDIVNADKTTTPTPLTGSLVIDGKKAENSKFSFSGKLEVPAIELSMSADVLMDKNGFAGDFNAMIQNLFDAQVKTVINPSNIDDLYLLLRFSQKFQEQLIAQFKKYATETVKTNIDGQIHALQAALDTLNKGGLIKEKQARDEENRRREMANKDFAQCKLEWDKLNLFRKGLIYAAAVGTPVAVAAVAADKTWNEIPTCNRFFGNNALSLKNNIEKNVWIGFVEVTSTMKQAVIDFDKYTEQIELDKKLSEGITKIVNELSKAMVTVLSVFNLKSAKIEIDGKKIKAGATPTLSFEAEFDLSFLSKDLGKKNIKIDNLGFNFKDTTAILNSLADLAKKVWDVIQDDVTKWAKKAAAEVLTAAGRPDLAKDVYNQSAPTTPATPAVPKNQTTTTTPTQNQTFTPPQTGLPASFFSDSTSTITFPAGVTTNQQKISFLQNEKAQANKELDALKAKQNKTLSDTVQIQKNTNKIVEIDQLLSKLQ